MFRKTIALNENAQPGTWRLSNYNLQDQAGNRSNLPSSLAISAWGNQNDSEEVRELKTQLLSEILGVNTSGLKTSVLNDDFNPAFLFDNIDLGFTICLGI